MRTFIVYVSENMSIAISADNWEKISEDAVIFTKGDVVCKPKVVAIFNFKNIVGICET